MSSRRMMKWLWLAIGGVVCLLPSETRGQQISAEPDWVPFVLGPPSFRSEIKALPIEQRPYRPLHFYGNTVRREYYRGAPVPLPRDWWNTGTQLVKPRYGLPTVGRKEWPRR